MNRDLVVIGASAGGVEALRAVVSKLPADLPATVLVVLHIPPARPSALVAILRRAGSLEVEQPVDGVPAEPGRLYVAPPDHHLLIRHGRLQLTRGPRENGHRPAIDPLFRSAARDGGARHRSVQVPVQDLRHRRGRRGAGGGPGRHLPGVDGA